VTVTRTSVGIWNIDDAIRIARRFGLCLAIVACAAGAARAQDDPHENKWSIGYETLEMTMNEFHYFAGEVGYKLDERSQLRGVVAEVSLSEQHLAVRGRRWPSTGPTSTDISASTS
jgi:hypothetical protein